MSSIDVTPSMELLSLADSPEEDTTQMTSAKREDPKETKATCAFLDTLPREVRNTIYGYVFRRKADNAGEGHLFFGQTGCCCGASIWMCDRPNTVNLWLKFPWGRNEYKHTRLEFGPDRLRKHSVHDRKSGFSLVNTCHQVRNEALEVILEVNELVMGINHTPQDYSFTPQCGDCGKSTAHNSIDAKRWDIAVHHLRDVKLVLDIAGCLPRNGEFSATGFLERSRNLFKSWAHVTVRVLITSHRILDKARYTEVDIRKLHEIEAANIFSSRFQVLPLDLDYGMPETRGGYTLPLPQWFISFREECRPISDRLLAQNEIHR